MDKQTHSYKKGFLFSVTIHLLLISLLLFSIETTVRKEALPQMSGEIVQASLIDEPAEQTENHNEKQSEQQSMQMIHEPKIESAKTILTKETVLPKNKVQTAELSNVLQEDEVLAQIKLAKLQEKKQQEKDENEKQQLKEKQEKEAKQKAEKLKAEKVKEDKLKAEKTKEEKLKKDKLQAEKVKKDQSTEEKRLEKEKLNKKQATSAKNKDTKKSPKQETAKVSNTKPTEHKGSGTSQTALGSQTQKPRDPLLAIEIDKYEALMKDKINQYWVRPAGLTAGLSCELYARLLPDGSVVSPQIKISSGNLAFDQAAMAALEKASPLPMPSDPHLLDEFRQFNFRFSPPEET